MPRRPLLWRHGASGSTGHWRCGTRSPNKVNVASPGQEFSWSSSALAMPPAEADRYTVVVVQPGPHSPWRWEIYRNGEPLPARLLKGDFGNRHAAKVAGNLALLEFLAALGREQKKDA
jgi:hypothetical protein